MPYIVMRRTDIPNGVLQIEDLQPNTSQKNAIYEPGLGQSGYVRKVPASSTVVLTAPAASRFIVGDQQGLAAYFMDTVEDSAGPALVAGVANLAALTIFNRVIAGLTVTLADVNTALVGAGATVGTTLTGGTSTGTLAEVLEILQGAVYEVPDGAQVQALTLFVPLRRGSFAPDIQIRTYYLTGAFRISHGEGKMAGYLGPDFTYAGVVSPAIVVYADDGTLFV